MGWLRSPQIRRQTASNKRDVPDRIGLAVFVSAYRKVGGAMLSKSQEFLSMVIRILNVTNVREITESPENKALEASYDRLLAELDRQEAESNSAPEGDADESVA